MHFFFFLLNLAPYLWPHIKSSILKIDSIHMGGSKSGWGTQWETFSRIACIDTHTHTHQEKRNNFQNSSWVKEAVNTMSVSSHWYKTKNGCAPLSCMSRQEARTSWMLPAPHISPYGRRVNSTPFISSSNSELTSAPKVISLRETRS